MSSPHRHRHDSRYDTHKLDNIVNESSSPTNRYHTHDDWSTNRTNSNHNNNNSNNHNHRDRYRSRDRSRSFRNSSNHDRDERRSTRYDQHLDSSSLRNTHHNSHHNDHDRDRYRNRSNERSHRRNKNSQDRDYRTSSRQEADHEIIDEISPTPTNCLLIRKFPLDTTEERILEKLGTISSVAFKNIRILRENTGESRGLCLVELNSVNEAHHLYNRLTSIRPPFEIDGNVLISTFGRKNSSTKPQILASNAATAALEAAQWTNRSNANRETIASVNEDLIQSSNHNHNDSGFSKTATISSLGTINLDGSVYKKWPLPDITTYVLEEKSGFLYDHMTEYYYDPNSRYYYDSANTRYLYYDPEHQAYLPAELLLKKNESGKKVASSDTQIGNLTKQEKVKTATKVAKDMEKWAKTLNQKRDALKSSEIPSTKTSDIIESTGHSSTKKTSRSSFQKITLTKDLELSPAESPKQIKVKSSIFEDVKKSFVDVKQLLTAKEERLIDLEKLACLLCNRGFKSKELLSKHKDMSQLHATNLEKLKTDMFTIEQIEEFERHEREIAYRDRAKERRQRHGPPDDVLDTLSSNKYRNNIELDSALKATHCELAQSSSADVPLGLDNKGASLMSKMGWKEGSGIGRSNQGMKDILKVEARVGKAGLGVKTYKQNPGISYKEAVKQVMYQRYRELEEEEDNQQ